MKNHDPGGRRLRVAGVTGLPDAWSTFMKSLADARLYGILDLGYVAAQDAPDMARRMVEGGVDVLQVRAKGWLAPDVLALAAAVRPWTAEAGVPLILNDHPFLVPRAGADGAHIGQDDGPLGAARSKAGDGKIVGRSTHSVEQALAARDEGADYLGFGPLFATPTKPDYHPIGLEDIATVHAAVTDRPVFCIGGIKRENLPEVMAAGARRVVIVSGILQAADVVAYCREVGEMLRGVAVIA